MKAEAKHIFFHITALYDERVYTRLSHSVAMNSLQSFLYVDFGGTCLVQFLLERITTDRNGWTIIAASMGGLQIWHSQTKSMTILQRSNWKARIGSTMLPVIIFLDGYMVLPKMKNWIITIYQLYICMCVVIITQIIYSIIPYVVETQMVRMKAN